MTKVLKVKKQNKSAKSRTKNKVLDSIIRANKPGKRQTAWGTIYYEKRENRSDSNPEKFPFL